MTTDHAKATSRSRHRAREVRPSLPSPLRIGFSRIIPELKMFYRRPEQVVLTSPLRLATVRMTPPGAAEPYSGTALVPIGPGPLGLVLVRSSGLDFHRSELERVGQVGQIVGTVLAPV